MRKEKDEQIESVRKTVSVAGNEEINHFVNKSSQT